MAVRRTNNPSQPPPNPALTALLDLSGALTRSTTGGIFSEALTCVFDGTGLHSGVVHEVTATGLELVAAEGLSPAIRTHIGSLSASVPSWFVAQEAVKRRRMIIEEDTSSMFGTRVPDPVLRSVGWKAVATAPIVFGRDAFGAISVASPSGELFTPQRLGVLETVANMVALYLAHAKLASEESPGVDAAQLTEVDEKLTRLATLGSLAQGFADDLRAVTAQLAAFIKHHEKWLEQLRFRIPAAAPLIREFEPLQEEIASALMIVRTSGGRLLTALDESATEVLELSTIVQEVVGHLEPQAREKNVDILVAIQPGSDPSLRGKRSEIRQMVLGLVSDGIEACGREDKPDAPTMPAPQTQLVALNLSRDKTKLVLTIEHSRRTVATEHRQTTGLRSSSSRTRGPIGLLLARNIVMAHGGTLEVTRSELGGALVRVVLPAATPPPSSKRTKGGPTSSKRARQNAPTLDAFPTTKRDGWTAKPNTIKGQQPGGIRAPARSTGHAEESPMSEVDMLASTERGATLAAQVGPGRQQDVVITDCEESGAPTIPAPPSTRQRSVPGPSTKRRG